MATAQVVQKHIKLMQVDGKILLPRIFFVDKSLYVVSLLIMQINNKYNGYIPQQNHP